MKIIKNRGIRAKLVLLILIMAIGTTVVGAIGYYNNMVSSNALKKMYTENLIAIEKLSDARTQSRAIFADILNLMVTGDEASKKTLQEDINTRNGKIIADFDEFTKNTALSKYENDQMALINENLLKWNDISTQMVQLISSGKQSDAISLFDSEGETTFENLQTSIRDLESFNVKSAEEIYKTNNKDQEKALLLLLVTGCIILIVCILLGTYIAESIIRAIKKVVKLIKKTSDLDLVYENSYDVLLKRKDEIGVIAREVEDLRNVLRNMAGNILGISTDLAASSEELAASTEENTKTIRQIVNAVNEIAEGNSVQAETVEKTSETTTAMVSSIDRVNRATAIGSENANKSMEIIEEGQKAIDLTMVKMKENIKVSGEVGASIHELSQQMDKVGNIVNVIKSISEQTNLLALNASIEAARAGEAGKGFAVVASEIGKLANHTADAVNEITGIISDAISRSSITAENNDKAMGIVNDQEKAIGVTIEAFDNIKQSVTDIAKRIAKISESISSIDVSSKDISRQMLDMSAIAEEAAASSEEISASNEEQLASIEMIAAAANDLSQMASNLNNEVSKFKI